MKLLRKLLALFAFFYCGIALAAGDAPLRAAQGVLVDGAGKTVYAYDKDTPGKSACTGACARNWPPVMAKGGSPPAPYSVITREDGGKQLAHGGKPLYTFAKDKKEGDKTGDGVGGAWHAVAGE